MHWDLKAAELRLCPGPGSSQARPGLAQEGVDAHGKQGRVPRPSTSRRPPRPRDPTRAAPNASSCLRESLPPARPLTCCVGTPNSRSGARYPGRSPRGPRLKGKEPAGPLPLTTSGIPQRPPPFSPRRHPHLTVPVSHL